MYDITRFEPFSELARLDPFVDAGNLFNAARPFFRTGMKIEPQIKMDVIEADGKYLVKAEIPGVSKDDIRVNIDRNRVSISAELKQQKESKEGERVIRSERSYGMASRSFSLADEVDQSGVEAKYSNGVLELTLPKKPGGTTRREIPIS